MILKKFKKAWMAIFLIFFGIALIFISCWRDNPMDAKSSKYNPGTRPYAGFVQRSISAFLFDTVSFKITWSDTAIGGAKGAIKKIYFNWNSDSIFNDSMDGTEQDTFTFSKTFPTGKYIVRLMAVDNDGELSDPDSINLTILTSRPRIDRKSTSPLIVKAAKCTVSVSASDTGGAINFFIWAKDGKNFNDTTVNGAFYVSFADTGEKLVLVKIHDNKGVESAVDTIRINVYEKLFATFYDGNGCTGGTSPADANHYARGQTVTVLDNTGFLVKSGYVFSGWNTLPNGLGANYVTGATFTMDTTDVTLFAQWRVSNTYGVTYNGNTNTSGTAPFDTARYTLGQSVTVKGNNGFLVKTGFTFMGWNTKANGTGIRYLTGVAFAMGASDVVLYAQWTADPTHTVTYNGNGNSGGTMPVDENNYPASSIVTVLSNTGSLEKTGFTFVGWNTQADGSGMNYASGVTFSMGSENVILYAQWTNKPTFIVKYDGNGNSAGTVPQDNNNYLNGMAVMVLGNTGGLVKTGYIFTGWDTLASGNGAVYGVGTTLIIHSANVTLFAQWANISMFAVTYNGNGNSGGTVPADNNHYMLGHSVTVLGNTGSLVKTGFTFIGWNMQANGAGISYATGVTFTMGASDVVLYAQWTADQTYSVTYNGNGNTGGTVPADDNNYTTGSIITVLGNTGTLVKTGFTFVGWNTRSNDSGTNYAAGATFTLGPANVTLFAQWSANPTYTVIYNGNSNSSGTVPKDNNNYLTGSTVTVLGNAGVLEKTGFTFTGWDTVASGNGTNYGVGMMFTMASANVILYAQWTIIPTYSVTYNGNGNSSGTAPIDNNHYILGQSVTVLGNTGALVKTGFTFIGWNTQANGSGISYAMGVAFIIGSSDVVVYAQWTANPTYSVSYNGNGNSGGTAPVDNNNYAVGSFVTVLGNTGAMVKTGFAFVGWNTQSNGGGTGYAAGTPFTIGSANVTLFAQWSANQTYTVTYNGNYNSGGGVPTDFNNYLTGATVTVLGNTGNLVRTGYAFVGWNTKADGNGTTYTVGATFQMASANVTLYARWGLTYTVTYNSNTSTGGNVPTDNARYSQGSTVTTRGNTGGLVKTGYTFAGWNTKADGKGTGYAAGVTFAMGASNVVLYAQWTIIATFTVTYDGNGNATGSVPADTAHYAVGQSVTVLGNTGLLEKTGFNFNGWNTKVNGVGGSSYAPGATFAMGPSNVILYAQWTNKPTFIITVNSGVHGSISPAGFLGFVSVLSGTDTTFSIKPSAYYHVDSVLVDGASQGSVSTYTFTNVGANHSIRATFAINTFVISASADPNGSISPSGEVVVDTGASQTFIIAPVAFHHIDSVFVDGASQGAISTYIFTSVGGNHTIKAKFAINTFTITASAGLNGSISPFGAVIVDTGASKTFTFTPSTNYHIDSVFVDGASQSAVSPYIFDKVGANHTVKVTFAIDTFVITASAGPNGSISPSGAIVVNAESSPVYTITPSDNYHIDSVILDGAAQSAVSPYTFYNVIGNHTIRATFAINTFTITASAGPHGSISPSGAVVVDTGANQIFTIAPAPGYHIDSVFVDGASQGALSTYTFEKVGDKHTIRATFAINTFTITASAGLNGSISPSGSVVVDTGASQNFTITPVSGYHIAGIEVDGTSKDTASTYAFSNVSANHTIAVSFAINTYTVTYDGNGNTGGTVPVDGNSYVTGANVTVLDNTGLEKTGFTFDGWNTTAEGTGLPFIAGSNLSIGSDNVILYALWK